MTSRNERQRAAASSARNARSIDGTKWHTVTSRRVMTSAKYDVSRWPPGRAITSLAPVINGQKNSQTDTSKLNGVFWSTTSLASS